MKNLMLAMFIMLLGCGVGDPPPVIGYQPVPDAAINLPVGAECIGDSQCESLVCTPVSCNMKVHYFCADTYCEIERGCINKEDSCIYAGYGLSFCVPKNVCDTKKGS